MGETFIFGLRPSFQDVFEVEVLNSDAIKIGETRRMKRWALGWRFRLGEVAWGLGRRVGLGEVARRLG
jgi:hypothetical protein